MTQSPIVGTPVSSPGKVSGIVGQSGHEPALKDVLVDLWKNLEKLVRQEIALARAELDVKAQKLKGEAAGVAIGAGLLLAGTLALVAAIILLLALFMPPWAASLITGAVAAVAGFAVVKANKPTAADVTPERTLQNLKKDIQTFTESSK